MQEQKYTPRKIPNIIVTGTPGTGKTTFCQLINQSLNFQYLPIAKLITEHKLYTEWNKEFEVPEFDDDLVVQHIAKSYDVAAGGLLFDFQNPQIFPTQYFDLIILLRCQNGILYKRLQQRGYKPQKIRQNIECQIFEQIKYNIEDHFQNTVPVLQLRNQQKEDMEKNLQNALNFLLEYKQKYQQTQEQPTP